MAVIVPFEPSIPNYRFSTTLLSQTYVFDVRWNARDDAWYFDILDSANSPILHGVKIVLGALLGGRCVDPRFPAGRFMACDMTDSGTEAKYDDLGVRVLIYFMSYDEIDAAVVT